MNETLPMKNARVYTDQANFRVTAETKAKIKQLADCGVDVTALVRPKIEELVDWAFKQFKEKIGA